MAIKLTLLRVAAPAGSPREAIVLITPSGNYGAVAGGDTMDLTQLFGQVGKEGATIDSDQLPDEAVVETLGGGGAGGGYYLAQLWTNPANGQPGVPLTLKTCLFRAFLANGTELTAGNPYTNGVLSDRIVMILKYPPAQ